MRSSDASFIVCYSPTDLHFRVFCAPPSGAAYVSVQGGGGPTDDVYFAAAGLQEWFSMASNYRIARAHNCFEEAKTDKTSKVSTLNLIFARLSFCLYQYMVEVASSRRGSNSERGCLRGSNDFYHKCTDAVTESVACLVRSLPAIAFRCPVASYSTAQHRHAY